MERRSFIKKLSGSVIMLNTPMFTSEYPFEFVSDDSKFGDFKEIIKDIWLIKDTCNVYLIKEKDKAIAIDFGSGQWLQRINQIGIKHLDHVFLTHHHIDQCYGLGNESSWNFTIHAPAGEEAFLDPITRKKTIDTNRFGRGCPISYSIPAQSINNVRYDMRGFGFVFWDKKRIRFMNTPGHGPNACSIILDHNDKQIVFCGDAAFEEGTIWHPFNLEWDHWTGKGTIAAWQGVKQLSDIGMDLLCPSHGPIIDKNPILKLKLLTHRLMDFYNVKNSISPDEHDFYLEPKELLIENKVKKILPSLYQYGNFYLLLSSNGEALVVDPQISDMDILKKLLNDLSNIRITAAVASHYHLDHCDALEYLRTSYNTRIFLHPEVTEPLRDVDSSYLPWLPEVSIIPDELWPIKGTWKWNEYNFQIDHAPGQTWWHCVFMTTIDGMNVCFTGDSFQPNTRWNGTGGFCAYNGCRFSNGFSQSGKIIQEWNPDIIAAGHSSFYRYSKSKFEKIIKWTKDAENVVTQLCPNNDILKHYFSLGVNGNANILYKPDISLLKNELFAWYT